MLAREQHYLDILFAGPEEERLNAAPKAGSSEGYKHPQAVKDLIASQRTGSIMSQATKELLSSMMSGPNNPFYGRTHSQEQILAFSAMKMGELNPMFGRAKSPEFIHMQTRDKSGPNNPQYGVVKSASTIAKLTKLVHVYDAESLVLLGSHSTTAVCKQFKIGNDTLYKYLASGLPYKGRIYRRTLV
jgi:group I intron endonuclease